MAIELRPILMRGLAPAGDQIDLGQMVEQLLRAPHQGDRPYLACSFISTLDGRATIDGSTEVLGFPADARVVMRLRTFADAVIIGAGTMRVEQYDRMIPVPRLRQYREQIGLPEDPLTVIVSGSLDLPWEAGLFTDGHGRVLIATTSPDSPPATATAVEVLRYDGRVDFDSLLTHLAEDRGVGVVVCEGGPTVLHALVEEGVVDDLFLTLNPVLAGGGERSLMRGALPQPVAAELTWAFEVEGELFTRWRIAPPEDRSIPSG